MALLDTIKERLGTAGQITTDIAKRTAETVRLRDQIRRDKKEINKLTYEIGETYLRLHADDYEEVYKEYIDGIAAAKASIKETEDALARLKEKAEVVDGDITEVDDDAWDDLFDHDIPAAAEEVKEAAEEVAETAVDAVEEAVDAAQDLAEEAVEETE